MAVSCQVYSKARAEVYLALFEDHLDKHQSFRFQTKNPKSVAEQWRHALGLRL